MTTDRHYALQLALPGSLLDFLEFSHQVVISGLRWSINTQALKTLLGSLPIVVSITTLCPELQGVEQVGDL
jgi:hypothetical protein